MSEAAANTPENAGLRLPLLDGLRGLAALCVLLYHGHNLFHDDRWFAQGYLFVDFFFLLSGFVLTLAAEPKFASGLTTGQFMRGRLVRLWPTIAIGAALGAVVHSLLGGIDALPLLALALLMIPSPWLSEHEIFPLNGPQWSLLWELVANLMHGLLLRRLSNFLLLVVAGFSGFLLIAMTFASGHLAVGAPVSGWWWGFIRVFWTYPLGIWIARRYLAAPPRQVARWWIALIAPIGFAIALPFLPISQALGDMLFVIAGVPLLFWLALGAQPPEHAVAALTWLGELSFPIYAVHLPLLRLFASFSTSMPSRIAAYACAIAFAALLARVMKGGWTIAPSKLTFAPMT